MAIPPGLGPIPTPPTGPGNGTRKTEETGPVSGPASGNIGAKGGKSDVPQGGGDASGGVATIAPSGTTAPRDIAASSDRLDSVLSTISDPSVPIEERMAALKSLVNDPGLLAELIIKFATMSREQALDARLSARDQARAQLEGQASETREAAAKAITAAVINFAVSVASAVISIGSAKQGLKALKEVDGLNTNALKFNTQSSQLARGEEGMGKAGALGKYYDAETSSALQKSQHLTAIHQGVAKLFEASGQLMSGVLDGASKIDEAQGQELAAAAQDNQAMADFAKKQMEDMEELLKAAKEFMKELNRLESELMANFTRLG